MQESLGQIWALPGSLCGEGPEGTRLEQGRQAGGWGDRPWAAEMVCTPPGVLSVAGALSTQLVS